MKLWITAGIAVCWVAVFSVWVVSQDEPTGGSDPTVTNTNPAQVNQNEQAPQPQNRADWQQRSRKPWPHGPRSRGPWPHGTWRPGGPERMRREAYGFGLVLLTALDKNKDAVLSEDEIAHAGEALLTLDENGDGEVSREELSAAIPAAMAALHGNGEDSGEWHGRDWGRRWHRQRDDSEDRPAPREAGAHQRERPEEDGASRQETPRDAGTRGREVPWNHNGGPRPPEPNQ